VQLRFWLKCNIFTRTRPQPTFANNFTIYFKAILQKLANIWICFVSHPSIIVHYPRHIIANHWQRL